MYLFLQTFIYQVTCRHFEYPTGKTLSTVDSAEVNNLKSSADYECFNKEEIFLSNGSYRISNSEKECVMDSIKVDVLNGEQDCKVQ